MKLSATQRARRPRHRRPPKVSRRRSSRSTSNGQRLVASITTEAAHELGLTDGSDVVAIIKTSDDVILATAD